MSRPDERARPHDEADPVREALDAFNADEALDDPDELEPDEPEPRPLNPDGRVRGAGRSR
jgi:hypothetical protein